MRVPKGFSFAGINAGIKASRRDVALVYSEVPATAAGVVTVNKAQAAPITDARQRLPGTGFRAIFANSGNANALTGPAGMEDVRAIRARLGRALGIDEGAVLTASTGVIGVPLPMPKLLAACDAVAKARSEHIMAAAEAIMTTDTRVKLTSRVLQVGGVPVTIAAMAKGSGMIAPQLATMLAFVVTDASVDPKTLQGMLARATAQSFDNLTVDGDMSTNDAVFCLANGAAGAPPLRDKGELASFEAHLVSVCVELARAIAEDGEGATKLVEVTVTGLEDRAVAEDLARSIAGSSLVKAAIFGADPNWGRVLATVGARAGSRGFAVDPFGATVEIQGVTVYANGGPAPHEPGQLRAKMKEPTVAIQVRLGPADTRAVAWGCDLSYDYVKINADYTSLTSAAPDGTVTKDDRLGNYSPSFKRALLVEALSYISRFKGKRTVIKYGGAAMIKEGLKASFANDVNLLRSAGLLPIVVHGGGPEISRTLEKLGSGKSEFIDGVRVTDAADVKVVEMVLTGKVNTEIVSLLNQLSCHAVGLSGKDAGLLRARKLLAKDGRDLGRVGEITQVNHELVEVLLEKSYLPVISPVGLGEDGEGYNINADTAAAEIAIALQAEKLIYLTDVPGLLDGDDLVSEITVPELEAKLATGAIKGGMAAKIESVLRALRGGVRSVHIVDGRTPHSLVAELFTDRGIGTLIKSE